MTGVIRRLMKNVGLYKGDAPEASIQLENDGFTVLQGVFSDAEIDELRAEIDAVFETVPAERVRDQALERADHAQQRELPQRDV